MLLSGKEMNREFHFNFSNGLWVCVGMCLCASANFDSGTVELQLFPFQTFCDGVQWSKTT